MVCDMKTRWGDSRSSDGPRVPWSAACCRLGAGWRRWSNFQLAEVRAEEVMMVSYTFGAGDRKV
jgi:hypothetical protein